MQSVSYCVQVSQREALIHVTISAIIWTAEVSLSQLTLYHVFWSNLIWIFSLYANLYIKNELLTNYQA